VIYYGNKLIYMKNLIYALLAVSIIFSACKKEEGCTDPTATNYNSDAKKDDGSCAYITGCMDNNAINYDETATKDGGCLYSCTDTYAINFGDTTSSYICEYEADVVFYLEELTSDYFTSDTISIPFLDVYNGNELVGTLPTVTGFPTDTDCESTAAGLVHFKYSWQDSNQSTIAWMIRDGDGAILYQDEDVVIANNCLKKPLGLPLP